MPRGRPKKVQPEEAPFDVPDCQDKESADKPKEKTIATWNVSSPSMSNIQWLPAPIDTPVPAGRKFYEALTNLQKALFDAPPPAAGASLNDMLDIIRPILTSHGFLLYWVGELVSGSQVMSTVLHHLESNEQMKSHIPMGQIIGAYPSAVGVLAGMLGITVLPSNPGNGVSGVIGTDWRRLERERTEEEAYKAKVRKEMESETFGSQSTEAPKVTFPEKDLTAKREADKQALREGIVKLDLKSLEVNKALAVIGAAETPDQLEIVIDGLVGGEAWIDLNEREQLIQATRKQYAKVKAIGATSAAFINKMKKHASDLESDRQIDAAALAMDQEEAGEPELV